MSADGARRAARRRGGLVGALLAVAGCSQPAPHVLLVTLDALRQDHLSLSGYARPTSPNIDRLAREGRLFRDIVPTSCSTKASLTSLLTSLDYANHLILAHKAPLDASFETLAETFRGHGYETIGVVATPHLSAALGYDQGFASFDDFAQVKTHFLAADRVVDSALERLAPALAGGRPVFAYLHLEEPHPPWVHSAPWSPDDGGTQRFFQRGCTYVPTAEDLARLTPAERDRMVARYDAAIRFADAQIGRLLDFLREHGELERTVVAVSTDHGLELVDRSTATHGFAPYQEVLGGFLVLFDGRQRRSPRGGGSEPQGRIFDVGPTLLAAAGLPVPAGVDGRDLVGDAARLPRYAFATCYGSQVVREGNLKLIAFDFESARAEFPLARRPVGFVDGLSLFDLRADPGERREVGDERAADRERLRLQLERSQARTRPRPDDAVPADARSDEEIERLRALGYVG